MKNGFEIVTTPAIDGTITQELYSVFNGTREQITRKVIATQEQQVRDALIALGWTPPNP